MITIEVTRGTSIDRVIQARNLDGSLPTVGDFLPTDIIAATVSYGEGYPSMVSPAVGWNLSGADVTTGKFALTIADPDTAALEAGDYLLQVTNTRAGRTSVIAKAILRVLGTIGTMVVPKVYCSYADLETELSWIGELKDIEKDLTGFLKQRGMARVWMDSLILRAQPGRGAGLISTQRYWTWDFGGSMTWGGNTLGADPTLTGYLNADGLILTSPYGAKIVDACTYWTLSKILGRTGVVRQGTSMMGLASDYSSMANFEASTATAEIDINADGIVDMTIPLSITNTRYG